MEALVGVQVGLGQYALLQVIPSEANLSRLGVDISELMHPRVFQCCWSVVISRTFFPFDT